MAIIEATKLCETNLSGKEFSFSSNASKLFLMLSDYLYSDKEYCVISELASNALDAHTMVGKQDVPIYVDIPTQISQQLVVRDYGPGLSEHDVYSLLTQYGESTKQQSQDFIGAWGIGSKSPAAVTDNWTIKSYHGGKMKHYEVFIDSFGVPKLTKIFECETEETGLEVIVPANNHYTWKSAAQKAFQWYPVKPKLNVDIQYTEYSKSTTVVGDSWYFTSVERSNLIITTNREYQLSNEIVKQHLPEDIKYLLPINGLVMHFGIGEIDVSISREQIQYTEKTIKNIVTRYQNVHTEIEAFYKKYITNETDEIEFKSQAYKFILNISPYGLSTAIFRRFILNKFGIENETDVRWVYSQQTEKNIAIVKGTRLTHVKQTDTRNGNISSDINIRRKYDYQNRGYNITVGAMSTKLDNIIVVERDITAVFARVKAVAATTNNTYIIVEPGSNLFDNIKQIKVVKASSFEKIKKEKQTRIKYRKNLYVWRGSIDGFNRVYASSIIPAKSVLIGLDSLSKIEYGRSSSTDLSKKCGILQNHNYNVYYYLLKKDKPDIKTIYIDVALKDVLDQLMQTEDWKEYYSKNHIREMQLFVKSFIGVYPLLQFAASFDSTTDDRLDKIKDLFKDYLDDFKQDPTNRFTQKPLVTSIAGQVLSLRSLLNNEVSENFKELKTAIEGLQNTYPLIKYITYSDRTVDFLDYFKLVDASKGE